MFNTRSSATLCASCTVERGITSCEGCRRKFCPTCLQNHRQELSLQLDELMNRRNELSETLHQQLSTDATNMHPCYNQVDQWEKQMQANISRIASTARQQIRHGLSETKEHIQSEFDGLSKKLLQHAKTGDFIEDDLDGIQQQFNQIDESVRNSTQQIRLEKSASERINWDALIFVQRGQRNQNNTAPVSASPLLPLHNSSMQVNGSGSVMYKPATLVEPYNSRASFSQPTPASSQFNDRRSSTFSNSSYSTGNYTCVCCKTSNRYNPHGENRCSVCRSPALL